MTNPKSICITGAAGLIGSELVKVCRERWPDAVIGEIDLKNTQYTRRDCRDFFAKDSGGWDVAINCAAITGGIEGTTNNGAFQAATNSQIDGAFCQWALRTKPKRIVYISSSCAYPMLAVHEADDDDIPLTESDIDLDSWVHQPDMPYGWAKLNGEIMANAVRDAGVPTSVVRPFAIYGSSQEDCRMIPAFVKRAMDKTTDTLEVWGPGTQASDFCHVSDAANAIIEMVKNDIDGPVNICTGRGATADEVARIVMDRVGVKKEIVHNTQKPFGPRWRVGDPTLLHTFYEPRVSLEHGVNGVVIAHL